MDLNNFIKNKTLPLYQWGIANLHDLRFIFLELTHRCNLACLHCGSDCKKNNSTPELSVQKIETVLDEIKTKYDPHKIMIILSGGEPLCYNNLFDLGKKINEKEFPWGLVTNGYAWTQATIKQAKKTGLNSIAVSLDGFAEDHNWLRGKKDSFTKTVNTIKMLIDDPFYQTMDVITCVNKRNIEKLDALYEFIKNAGIKNWRLFLISPIGRANDNPELFLNGNEINFLFKKIISFKNKKEISVNYSESGYLGSAYEYKVRNHNYFCMAGINVAGIMVNGDILACPNIDRRFKQGNIDTDSFINIWENKFSIFRNRSWMKTGKCRNCKEWKLCKGNSFHLWDIDRNSTKLCHFQLLSAIE